MLVSLVFVMVVVGMVVEIRSVSAAPPAKPIKLRMMMPGEPGGAGPLNPFHAVSVLAEPVVWNVMEPLVDIGKKGEFIPRLATKWEHSADLTKWRFYLRKGVKFHNGADFTARDVVEFAKWNIELKHESNIYKFLPLKEAVAVDNYTVDFIFGTPQPLFLIGARVFLIPPVAISRDNREMYKTKPMGTGPYRFMEWKRGQHIKLARFDGYWGPKPQIDEVEIIFRQEEAVRLAALMAGEADWVYGLSPESISDAVKVARNPSPDTVLIKFDEYVQKEFIGKDPIFSDKRLRLAVEYAIDRKALISLFGGFATLSLGQFASPGEFGFNPNLNNRPYDLEKAKALVREAGAVGKTVTFVSYADKWTKCREVAEATAYMIEQTGLKVKLMLLPKAEAIKYWRVLGEDRPFMSDIIINSTDALLEVESRYPQLFVQDGACFSLADLEPTRLYKEVQTETNYAKRGEKLAKAWAYVYEQSHYIPLFKLESVWGLAKNLEWKADIAGRPFIADMSFTN